MCIRGNGNTNESIWLKKHIPFSLITSIFIPIFLFNFSHCTYPRPTGRTAIMSHNGYAPDPAGPGYEYYTPRAPRYTHPHPQPQAYHSSYAHGCTPQEPSYSYVNPTPPPSGPNIYTAEPRGHPENHSTPPPEPSSPSSPVPYTYDDEEPDTIPIGPARWNNFKTSANKEELIAFFMLRGYGRESAENGIDKEFASHAPQHRSGQNTPGPSRAQSTTRSRSANPRSRAPRPPPQETYTEPPLPQETHRSPSPERYEARPRRTHSPPPAAHSELEVKYEVKYGPAPSHRERRPDKPEPERERTRRPSVHWSSKRDTSPSRYGISVEPERVRKRTRRPSISRAPPRAPSPPRERFRRPSVHVKPVYRDESPPRYGTYVVPPLYIETRKRSQRRTESPPPEKRERAEKREHRSKRAPSPPPATEYPEADEGPRRLRSHRTHR